jgi:hypothetical protein
VQQLHRAEIVLNERDAVLAHGRLLK